MSVRDYSEKVKFKDIIIGEELSLREYQAELFRYFFDNSKTILCNYKLTNIQKSGMAALPIR